jgi:hypothetical protein
MSKVRNSIGSSSRGQLEPDSLHVASHADRFVPARRIHTSPAVPLAKLECRPRKRLRRRFTDDQLDGTVKLYVGTLGELWAAVPRATQTLAEGQSIHPMLR